MKAFCASQLCPVNRLSWLPLVALVAVLLDVADLSSAPVGRTLRYDERHVTFESVPRSTPGGTVTYDLVHYKGLEPSHDVAAPQLPVDIFHIALPPGRSISRVTITGLESEVLPGHYDLYPVQPPQVLSSTGIRFVGPDPAVYRSDKPFPRACVRRGPSGHALGYEVGTLIVYPLQYLPARRQLLINRTIQIDIEYEPDPRPALASYGTDYTESIRRRVARSFLEESEAPSREGIEGGDRHGSAGHPPGRNGSSPLSAGASPAVPHEYVIVTGDHLVGRFQPLADWKRRKGLSPRIVPISWIYANYEGRDGPEQIRAFVRDAHEQWGTLWFLLGGDVNVVPARTAYAMDCELGVANNRIPCDLYYGDLDGDWDGNGNGLFGEVADEIDMFPDVFVGRAPVENGLEADAWVGKVLTYERAPVKGHELNMLFLAEVLWDNPYTDSGLGKDHIGATYVPERYHPITRLYESLGNESWWSAVEALNAGQNIVNHNGHANTTKMLVGNGALTNQEMDRLVNGPRYSVLFSIGCFPGAFDYDCIAEHFLTNPVGGGVAFIGNSRFGWGSPGNPLYGYSDRFDQRFFKALFEDEVSHVGAALASAKATYVPFASEENVYRWCEYEINLLGDPEMPVWTDEPRELSVIHPDALPVGKSICPVVVTDPSGPVEGARVCLMQDTLLYETAVTGPNGRVEFEVTTVDPAPPVDVTVTARNVLPYHSQIDLAPEGPYVRIVSIVANGGAGDGLIEPGHPVIADMCLENVGSEIAHDVAATLRCSAPEVAMIDSVVGAGNIAAGASVVLPAAFSFLPAGGLANGRTIALGCSIADGSGSRWAESVTFTAATPVLTCAQHAITDEYYGNDDGVCNPGERIGLDFVICNTGLGRADGVRVHLSTASPHVRLLENTLSVGAIEPSGQAGAYTEIVIDARCPEPFFPRLDAVIESDDGLRFADRVIVAVGSSGFADDIERGEAGWSHTGDVDLWHVTSRRSHSGDSSWHCGFDTTAGYADGMDNALAMAQVIAGEKAQLTFWCWYELPTYGEDGLYVEVRNGEQWTTLDFIGSGGALGHLTTGNDWLEYHYDLSALPAGTTVEVRFRFVSTAGEDAEGVYIDDVEIAATRTEFTEARPHERLRTYQLHQNFPNPFNPTTTIIFNLPAAQPATVEIFDVSGTFVKTVFDEPGAAGPNRTWWDGTNDRGEVVSSGIYFYRMKAGAFRSTRKMLLLR